MTDQPAPQGVNLLKELLFEREARRLDDLSRRIDAQADATAKRDQDLNGRIDAVFERAGTQDRLLHSVAGVLDGALREAEVVRHEQLSSAIAPLVVRTIKYQLKESQEEMVDALYPITGRLVKSYVQSEVARMMAEINAKLGGRRATIAQESADSGISMSELALAEANKLVVEELFLVRRGSGELIAHWERPESVSPQTPVNGAGPRQEAAKSNRDVLISGYISGIMSLSEEAFGAKADSFRTLALANDERIFVRGAAAHLLAVRCKGSAGAATEQVIDEVFLQTLERYQKVLAADAVRRRVQPGTAAEAQKNTDTSMGTILPGVVQDIEKTTTARHAELVKRQAVSKAANTGPSFTRLYLMAGCLAAPFIAGGLWWAYQTYQTMITETAARAILASTEDIKGVPPKIDVAYGGRSVTLSGFVPDEAVRDQILRRLAQEVPQARVRNQLGVLPDGSGPAEIAVAALRQQWMQTLDADRVAALARPVERARLRVAALRSGVGRLLQQPNVLGREGLAAADRTLAEAAMSIARTQQAMTGASRVDPEWSRPLGAAWQKLGLAETQFGRLLGGPAAVELPLERAPPELTQLADDVAMTAERLSATQLSLTQTLQLADKIEHIRTPRDDLEAFVRASAVFFDNGVDFKDQSEANQTLDQLTQLLQRNPGVVVRVVGFTDEKGTAATNIDLGQSRANRVAGLLGDRGVPAGQRVAIGRLQGKDLSRTKGPGNVNRRVEFEIGFTGEKGDQ